MKKEISSYLLITLGSIIYAVATVIFIFPHLLVIGGTTGISIILNKYSMLSPGTISVIINFALLIVAFVSLGKNMAIKTLVGSTLTAVFIGVFEKMISGDRIFLSNPFLSSCSGAVLIAIASGILFYVNSSSGGTDIIALVVKKYSKINIGKALLITDFVIVIFGGVLSGYIVLMNSFVGLLIKTLGIDIVIRIIKYSKFTRKRMLDNYKTSNFDVTNING